MAPPLADNVSPMRHGVRLFGGAVLAGWAALAIPGVAAAEEPPPLETDRPGQTDSSNVVPAGTFQLEAALNGGRVDADGTRTDSADWVQLLGRWGLTERFELRFFWAGWQVVDSDGPGAGSREDGGGDFALGLKWKLREERGAAPRMALVADSSVPAGNRAFSSKRFDPGLRVAFSNTLSSRIGLAYSAGVAWQTVEDAAGERDTLSRFSYTLNSGFAIGARTGAFVELFGSVAGSSVDRGPSQGLDAGVTWRPRGNVQLDALAGLSLDEGADDWFVGLGVSARFPR